MQHGYIAEKNNGFQGNSWKYYQNPFPESKNKNLLIAQCKHFSNLCYILSFLF